MNLSLSVSATVIIVLIKVVIDVDIWRRRQRWWCFWRSPGTWSMVADLAVEDVVDGGCLAVMVSGMVVLAVMVGC